MKKKVLFSVLCLLCINAYAQNTYLDLFVNYRPTNFHYGNENSDLKDFKEKLWGWQAGFSFQGGITKRLSAVTEIYFVQKGGALEENNPLTNTYTKTRLNAVEIPLLARFHFCNFYLNTGPSIAYNFGGKVKIKGNDFVEGSSYKISFDGSPGSFKRWDAGLQVGAGYEFHIKKSRLALDLRYHYGLVDVSDEYQIYNRYLVMQLVLAKAWKKNPLSKSDK